MASTLSVDLFIFIFAAGKSFKKCQNGNLCLNAMYSGHIWPC